MDGHKDAWGTKSSPEIGFLSPLLFRPRRPKKQKKKNTNPIKGSLQTARVWGAAGGDGHRALSDKQLNRQAPLCLHTPLPRQH